MHAGLGTTTVVAMTPSTRTRSSTPGTGPATASTTAPPAPPGGTIRSLSRPQIGRLGEDIAAAHLLEQGWVILERNHRVARGELDIVALDGQTLVFVEVKTRRTVLSGVPQAAVDARKLRRLRLLASHYLLENSPPHRDLRIDVIAVMVADGAEPEIEHLAGVGA